MTSDEHARHTSQWMCTRCDEPVGNSYEMLPVRCPECENTHFRVPENTKAKCPDCGSRDIYNERSHGDTICRDCGWFTEQGGPKAPANWREIHAAK